MGTNLSSNVYRGIPKPSHLMDSGEMAELIRGVELEASELGIGIYGIGC